MLVFILCEKKEQLTAWEWGQRPRAAYEFSADQLFREAFLASLIPSENPPYHSTPQLLPDHPNSAWRHSLRQLGPSVQEETDLLAHLLTRPFGHPCASVNYLLFLSLDSCGDLVEAWPLVPREAQCV